jgi:hypothetical protein
MKLPFSFGLKKKEVKNYFLALLLQDEKIGAVVLEESNGGMHVVGHAEGRFPTALEEASFEEWLDVVDRAVSSAEERLPSKIQTEKTVFGVKQDWLIEGKIKRGYLTRLKKICEELSLQPIGFLVFTEAILHLLQKEEGAPVSAILVELGKKFIIISIIRAGRIVETKLIPFEEPVPQAVDTALKSFSVEILPARIIIFNSEENKELSQSFIGHSWSKGLPFLHMPQVTVLPANFDTKSVLFGTAAQLGFAVVGGDSLPTKTHAASSIPAAKGIAQPIASDDEETIADTEEKIQEPHEEQEEETEEKPESVLSDTVSADYFGFMQNADVANSPKSAKKASKQREESLSDEDEEVASEGIIEELPEEVKDEETAAFQATNFSSSATMLFAGVKNGLAKVLSQRSVKKVLKQVQQIPTAFMRIIHKNGQSKQNASLPFPLIWLVIPAIIIVFVIGALLYTFGVSAKVTLTATPKVLSQQQPITFITDGTSDFDKGVLVGQTVSTDEQGSLSHDATGTKEVGTSAKGQITIFSTLTSSTTIPKGTTVVSSNNLKYTIDSNVTVASSSGNAGDFITVSGVAVTAADIGPAYNLPSGMTGFSITGYSKGSVSAKNDAAFSGGTKKDVIVVAQADVDKLSSDLIKNLEEKAKADLSKQVGGNKMLLPFFTKEDISQKTLSKKVGEEAQNISLDATVTYEGLVVDKDDMKSFASHILEGDIPTNMTLTADGIHTDLTDIKQDKDSVSGTLTMQASLLPKIDTTQLTKTLAGKSFQQAGDVVKALPQIQSVDFSLSPSIPFLPKLLPRLPNHITISLLSQ